MFYPTRRIQSCVILLAAILGLSACNSAPSASAKYFGSWPDGADPKVVGLRVSDNFANRKFRFEGGNARQAFLIYPEAIAWYGSLTFADVTHNQELINKLAAKFNPF